MKNRKPVDFNKDFSSDFHYSNEYEMLTWKYGKGYDSSPFKGKTYADVFLCAMTLGFKNDSFVDFKAKKNANIPASALKEKGQNLVLSIAVARTKSLDVLYNSEKVYDIAEKYSNGGLPYLVQLVQSGNNIGTPIVRMENAIREEITIISEEFTPQEVKAMREEATPFEMIEDLEMKLRAIITRKLGEVSNNWMKERVPGAILDNWREIDKKRMDIVPPPPQRPLIEYSHLGELRDIILRRDNWNDKFKNIFKDERILEGQMATLIPIRNQVMHGGGKILSVLQRETLKNAYDIIMDLINSAK